MDLYKGQANSECRCFFRAKGEGRHDVFLVETRKIFPSWLQELRVPARFSGQGLIRSSFPVVVKGLPQSLIALKRLFLSPSTTSS
jgi:hypothetical protein